MVKMMSEEGCGGGISDKKGLQLAAGGDGLILWR
jgi:hypothetical protein